MDDLADRARVRGEALDLRVAARRERLAEKDDGLRAPGRPAAERDEVAQDGAHEEPGGREPPARDQGRPEAAEVQLLLGLEIGGRHRAATLPEAQDQ